MKVKCMTCDYTWDLMAGTNEHECKKDGHMAISIIDAVKSSMIKLTMETTALVTTTLIITLGIYDLICVTFGSGVDLSVSQFLVNTAFNAPVVVFAFGFICGHIFGYMKPEKEIKK